MNLFPMMKEQYEAYLKSFKWRQLRLKIFKRDGYKCVECHSKWNLQAHHLTYERVGEERLEDLETRCRACHEKQHKGDLLIKLIEICCKRFLSQGHYEDYNPKQLPKCHGCKKTFFDWKEIRFHYGTTAFGSPGVYCEACVAGIREQLTGHYPDGSPKSQVPYYVKEIQLYIPAQDSGITITYEDDHGEIVTESL